MKAPTQYIPNFVQDPDRTLEALQNGLEWERRSDAPRCEYYCNDFPNPYVYGRGRGVREYLPRPMIPAILAIRLELEKLAPTLYPNIVPKFEVCFLNRYLNQSDHLGWHADDSPEMDDARPIVTVSLGVEREICFRPKKQFDATVYEDQSETRLKLGNGSACFMAPGMQDRFEHRIPKASFQCGERISLTFRGYVNQKRGGNNVTDACLHTGPCLVGCGCWCDTCKAEKK
jgi:alkylated DNA repair dioxygenase AlkB